MKSPVRVSTNRLSDRRWLGVLFACVAATLSCTPEAPPAPLATSGPELQLSPSNPQIAQGTAGVFTLREVLPSGRIVDRTAAATWQVTPVDGSQSLPFRNGEIELATPGRYRVTADIEGHERGTVIVVTSAAIRALTLTPKTSTVAKGLTQSYKATAAFTDGTTQDVTATTSWSIKDTSGTGVAVISSRGVVTTKNIGKARITAKYMTLSDTAALEVTAPKPTAISISPSNPTLPKGTAQTFTAKALFSDGSTQDVSDVADWSVTDLVGSGVASVDGVGNVLAEAEGQATVAAEYAGISGSTLLQVSAAVPVSVSLSPSTASIAKGLTQALTATARLSDGSSLNVSKLGAWTATDRTGSGVASVDANGLVRGTSLGTANISFAYRALSATALVEVTAPVVAGLAVSPATVSLPRGRTQLFQAIATYSDGSTQAVSSGVTWTATDVMGTSVIALSTGGLAVGSSLGEARVQAQYAGKSATAAVTVTAAVLERIDLSPLRPVLEPAASQQFRVIATRSDTTTQDVTTSATFSATDVAPATSVITLSSGGLATAKNLGRAKVSATYLGLRAETEVAVSRARVASLYCSVDAVGRAEVTRQLETVGGLTAIDSIDVGPAAPALSTLQQYAAVVIWADTSRGCSDPTGLGNVLAQYVDRGGGVVQILPYYLNYSYSGLSGDFYTRYSLVNSTNSMRYARDLQLGSKLEMHAILANVSTLRTTPGATCYHRSSLTASDLRNGGRLVATWSSGDGMVVVGSPGGHNRVDINYYVGNAGGGLPCLDDTSDAYRLLRDSLLWVAGKL
ncbi:MAG TPA: Ig-like domain-containing protein [Pseudomonadota bacterium]|nr:Ig-like domain-containing protein [Pseudomonadota bacterium]